MGFIDDKRDVFNQIGALTSVKDNINLPDPRSSLSSVNNSREIVPFLLDLLVVLVGSEVLKTTIGELMTGFVRNVEPSLVTELKKQAIEFNSDQTLPTDFATNGITIPAGDIDSFEKLKTDPASQTGSLLYNNDADDFDRKSYEAIQNAGTPVTFGNITITYNTSSNSFTYKPVNSSQTIGNFTADYIDGLTIINEKEFIANIMNAIFGTINGTQDKTRKQLIFEEKLDVSIGKLIDEEESIAISDDELREIEFTAEKRKEGIETVDVGCGVLINTVTIDSLENLVNTTTGSTDPLTVGNAYLDTIAGGFDPAQEAQAAEDGETIKDGFFKRLINAIVKVLVSAVIAPPQIRALFGMTSSFKNNNIPDLGDPIEDLEKRRKLADCLSRKAKATINEFLFNLIKTQLLNLIIPVSKIILKEKINQYLAILRSLIGFV